MVGLTILQKYARSLVINLASYKYILFYLYNQYVDLYYLHSTLIQIYFASSFLFLQYLYTSFCRLVVSFDIGAKFFNTSNLGLRQSLLRPLYHIYKKQIIAVPLKKLKISHNSLHCVPFLL